MLLNLSLLSKLTSHLILFISENLFIMNAIISYYFTKSCKAYYPYDYINVIIMMVLKFYFMKFKHHLYHDIE